MRAEAAGLARAALAAPAVVAGPARIAGYASLFGVADQARDVVEPGAFARTLRERGPAGVRMLFQHDPAEPIGRWTALHEDQRGLRVEGRLADGVARAREIAALIEEGAIDGLSIGFRTVRAAPDPGRRLRRILEAELWEVSVVTFPMLQGARVETAGLPPALVAAKALRRAAKLIEGKEGRA